MGSYSAIADTSETLVELIRDRINTRSDVVNLDRNEVALVSPEQVGGDSDVRLSLYLYSVTKNTVMNNNNRRAIDDETMRDPPLALDLEYLMTAYPSQGGNDETANTIDQQRVLGLAIQILRDNAVLGREDLQGSLGERDLHITMEQENVGTVTNIWNTFQDTPLHPSITYTVSPVLIDSTVEEEVPRVTEYQAEYREKTER